MLEIRRIIKNILMSILIVSSITLAGCASLKVKSSVEGNSFYSPYMPEVKILDEIEFLGKEESGGFSVYSTNEGANRQGSPYRYEYYLFGSGDNNTLKSAVIISSVVSERGSWLPVQFEKWKFKIDQGYLKIQDKTYKYAVQTSPGVTDETTKKILMKNEYVLPNCVMVMGISLLAGTWGDTRIDILYIEDINYDQGDAFQCSQWMGDVQSLDGDQENRLRDIFNRVEENVQFLGKDGAASRFEVISSTRSVVKSRL